MTRDVHPVFKEQCGHNGCQRPRKLGLDMCAKCFVMEALLEGQNNPPKREYRKPYTPDVPDFSQMAMIPLKGQVS